MAWPKKAIVAFVQATTTQGGAQFVPPEERIATFDQDGTLWVEQPIYSQVVYCLDRVGVLANEKPELKDTEPFKTVLSGDHAAIAKLSMKDLEVILMATLTGMTTDEFQAQVKQWLAGAKNHRWNRPYTDVTYQPMQEVLQYLRANGYKTHIRHRRWAGFRARVCGTNLWESAGTDCRHRSQAGVSAMAMTRTANPS